MQAHAGVFRTQAAHGRGCGADAELARAREADIRPRRQVARSSTPRAVEALEVDNLIEAALKATIVSAAARAREPRRAPSTTTATRRVPERPQRRSMDETHAVVSRRQSARLQAGQSEAADVSTPFPPKIAYASETNRPRTPEPIG